MILNSQSPIGGWRYAPRQAGDTSVTGWQLMALKSGQMAGLSVRADVLKKVEKSLRMIDDGSYGWCEETGEPIGVPRLIARPTATLSLEAQERRERVQKLYGDD